jgi:hypothetical protein
MEASEFRRRSVVLGQKKDVRVDPSWGLRNVIYRWVRASDSTVAMVGETERLITERVDNYLYAKAGGGAGSTNKRLCAEANRLLEQGDHLYLEIVSEVPGFDLNETRERRFAEALLTGIAKPYLK